MSNKNKHWKQKNWQSDNITPTNSKVDEDVVTIPEPEVEPEVTVTPATVTPEPEIDETPVVIRGTVTNCGKLNVRKAPSVDAAVVCEINFLTEVTIDEEKSTDEFYRVSTTSGIEGFCMKKFISIQQ